MAIGNGATGDRSLMERLPGKVGIIRPTFEEYLIASRRMTWLFTLPRRGTIHTADDSMEYFDDQDISSLILDQPDNPSGNYIQKKDLAACILGRTAHFLHCR